MSATSTSTVNASTAHRGWVITIAVLAIILGLIAFFIPDVTLLSIAIVFGIFLIASGAFRLVTAFTSQLRGWVRWLTGLLGGLTLVAGILCLSNPWNSLIILGVVIGSGWILGGVASIAERVGRTDKMRWLPVVAGLASIITGVLVMVMPVLALASFVLVAGILLVLNGIATLFLLSTGPTQIAGSQPKGPTSV